ncbi:MULTISPECIES: hypothetical protein [Flammeovirga]|uniref:Uncharacterized protein n=1 Tax=Flammeovirga agarivorans TaxID=2726742 RepID=A0A7X8SJ41_9BACT|nr:MULTISPECIES: hypothetical protein [Flammeovirga]NLR91161.1 hypothetical protein [Flammeovirga agarivorans]
MKRIITVLTSILMMSLSFASFADEVETITTKAKTPLYKVVDGKMKRVGFMPKGSQIEVKKIPHIEGKIEYKARVNYHETECGHLISTRYINNKK